jgi:hypothetical protein
MKSPIPAYAFGIAIVLATFASSCAENGPNPITPSAPEAPGAPTPAPSATLYTLSGVVYEATQQGNQEREGVSVYCDSCGSPDGHTATLTDRNGVYVFTHAKNGSTPLIVSKAGYRVADPAEELGDGRAIKIATVNGDTRFDIEIIRR